MPGAGDWGSCFWLPAFAFAPYQSGLSGSLKTLLKKIRDSSIEEHPDMKKFFDLHNNNMLRDPSDAADKLLYRIDELKIDDSGSFIKI